MQEYNHRQGDWRRTMSVGEDHRVGSTNHSTMEHSTPVLDRWTQIGLMRGIKPPPRKSQSYGSQTDSGAPTTRTVAFHRLEDSLNCALWLKNLPMGTTASFLTSRIRTGRISAIHINKPLEDGQLYAAKVVFMTHIGAQRLLEYLQTAQGIEDFGGLVKSAYNWNGFLESENQERSRVIRILGRAPYMKASFWMSYLEGMVTICEPKFYYQTTHCHESTLPDGRLQVEIGFARVSSQAFFVRQTILDDPTFSDLLDVVWGEDPCGC
ncbi:uncharacterized protein RSE6_03758 [Rhynchosporium secalis]|uniref:RRM domain-containing protein n=1 Tax=Rhynchosporium secalis TaxID=38038 RepID=A0A1E1M3K9_RHYSE|nr:uncharacterized protein RSE6_03758 [Rhynchosporium secalis]